MTNCHCDHLQSFVNHSWSNSLTSLGLPLQTTRLSALSRKQVRRVENTCAFSAKPLHAPKIITLRNPLNHTRAPKPRTIMAPTPMLRAMSQQRAIPARPIKVVDIRAPARDIQVNFVVAQNLLEEAGPGDIRVETGRWTGRVELLAAWLGVAVGKEDVLLGPAVAAASAAGGGGEVGAEPEVGG